MAITTSQITSNPGVQEFVSSASRFTVTVPAGSPTLMCSADPQGVFGLATIAAGTTTTFSNPGGFFFTSTLPSGATVVAVGSPAYELTAAGTTVTATSTETVSATTTIPANVLQLGNTIRIKCQGIQTAVNGADTCRFLVRIGPTTLTGQIVLDSTAVAGGVSYDYTGEFTLVSRGASGAAVAYVGYGLQNVLAAAGAAVLNTVLPSTNFATNGPLLVEASIKFSSANAGNSARVDIFEVIIN